MVAIMKFDRVSFSYPSRQDEQVLKVYELECYHFRWYNYNSFRMYPLRFNLDKW